MPVINYLRFSTLCMYCWLNTSCSQVCSVQASGWGQYPSNPFKVHVPHSHQLWLCATAVAVRTHGGAQGCAINL